MSDLGRENAPDWSAAEFVLEPDLLEPVLTEADDLVGFDKPWHPWSLVILTALTHFTVGGLFVALNQRRLGRKKRFWSTWLTFLGIGILTYSVWILIRLSGVEFTENEERLWRHGTRAIPLLMAFLFVRSQQRRFRVFVGGGGEPTSFFAWGFAGFLASFALEPVLVLIAALFSNVVSQVFAG